MSKKSAAKIVAPAVVAVAAFSVVALAHFGVIEIPNLSNTEAVTDVSETTESTKTTKKTDDAEKTTETSQSESTEEATSQTETTLPEVKLDSEKSLEKLLASAGSMYDFTGYSSTAKNAYREALGAIISPFGIESIYYDFCKGGVDYFETPEENFGAEEKEKRDPLEKFNNSYRYGRVSADNIDTIISDVFGAVADRDNALITEKSVCRVYYLDGYYYFSCEEGGNVEAVADIVTAQKNSDGTYTVTYQLKYDDGEGTPIGTFIALCTENGNNAKSPWKLLSFTKK